MTSANPTPTSATAAQNRPTASIVIPVHNKVTITRQCLDALLAESDHGISRQLVVVDDGSTDRTPFLLATYADRILVFRH
jgi:glycosyltransferase involved in cell wall biosynthesis